LTEARLEIRRSLLRLVISSPFVLAGCGTSQDDTQVKIGDATKAEAKARAEFYKQKSAQKQRGTPKR
jgi:hypothetical protein